MLEELRAACSVHKVKLLRSTIGTAIPAALLFLGSHFAPPDSIMRHTEFVQSMQWMLITYAAVSNPTVGKTTQKGIERSLGTIAGGLLGMLCALTRSALVQFVGMMLAAATGEFIVSHLKKENTGRLLPATYVMVSASAMLSHSPWLVACTRTAAILAGILLCFVMSICWYPQSASQQSYEQLLAMMAAVRDLGVNTWACWELDRQQHQQHEQQQGKGEDQQEQGEQKQQAEKQAQQQSVQQTDTSSGSEAAAAATARPAAQHGVQVTFACAVTPAAAAAAPAPAAAAAAAAAAAPRPAGDAASTLTTAPQPSQQMQTADKTPDSGMNGCEQQRQQSLDLRPPLQIQVADGPTADRQHLQDECERAMRAFFEARTKLKDCLATAAAEKQYFTLQGRPVFLPHLMSKPPIVAACSTFFGRLCGRGRGTSSGSNPPATAAAAGAAGNGHLPARDLTAVAISLRHCVHVWWMLLRLLLDGFDRTSLEAVTTARYPATMLQTIQQTSLAVLQQAMTCLQEAVQSLHHQQRRQQQPDASVEGSNLLLLRGNMSKLRGQLALWRQIYLTTTTLKRTAIENLKQATTHHHHHSRSSSSSQLELHSQLQQLQQLASAGAGEDTGAAGAADGPDAGVEQQQQQQSSQLAMSPSSARLADAAAAAAAAVVSGDDAAAQQAAAAAVALFYVTPNTADGALFALQWHALHYCLKQLEEAFEDMAGQLEHLLHSMTLQKVNA